MATLIIHRQAANYLKKLPKVQKEKIKKGTRVNVYDEGKRIIVEPIPDDPIQKGRGMLKTKGKILRALVEDKKKEAEL